MVTLASSGPIDIAVGLSMSAILSPVISLSAEEVSACVEMVMGLIAFCISGAMICHITPTSAARTTGMRNASQLGMTAEGGVDCGVGIWVYSSILGLVDMRWWIW